MAIKTNTNLTNNGKLSAAYENVVLINAVPCQASLIIHHYPGVGVISIQMDSICAQGSSVMLGLCAPSIRYRLHL